jgi:hypothetical protein
MKSIDLTFPELGTIAATRGMLGVGAGLLVANVLPDAKRKAIGWTLLAIGALSTIPLAIGIFGRHARTPRFLSR